VRRLLHSVVENRLELYYGILVACVAAICGIYLLGVHGPARLILVAPALVALVEGVGLLTNWGGRTTAAVARYKSPPTTAWARAMPGHAIRFAIGGFFTFAGLAFLYASVA